MIIIKNTQSYPIDPRKVTSIAKSVLEAEGISFEEVGIHFVDEREICELHEQFFGDPTPTDCISFPLKGPQLLGDIFVCPQIALTYAQKYGKDPFEELILYVIHGLLHLIGYDDMDVKSRAKMRRAEKRHMNRIFKGKN